MSSPMVRRNIECGGYVLVMGVSGVGKSTIGRAIADHFAGGFVEADDHHAATNIEMMRARRPLTDDLRWPWLKAVSEAAEHEMQNKGGTVVIACSALKRSYRDFLRQRLSPLFVIHLAGSRELIESRMRGRRSHFMPAELLVSQIATLEAPDPDEDGIVLSVDEAAETVASRAIQAVTADRSQPIPAPR